MEGEEQQVPLHEEERGRKAAWLEVWRRTRAGQEARLGAKRERRQSKKRKAAGGWPPEERRAAGRQRLATSVERARAGARAAVGDDDVTGGECEGGADGGAAGEGAGDSEGMVMMEDGDSDGDAREMEESDAAESERVGAEEATGPERTEEGGVRGKVRGDG